MATKQYRCIVDALNIRTEPRSIDSTKTGQQLKFGEIITVDVAARTEADGSSWVKHERGWSVERTLDGRGVYLLDALQHREKLFGINIDPNNPRATASADRLFGAGWVRFVFHVESRRESLEQSFTFYDPIIRSYAQTGTRILLILLQDTYAGNVPWINGDWRQYARGFAERAGQIARRYRGLVSAYQIWNEGDNQGQPTSIYIKPEDYAPLILAASQSIAQADPLALVVTGGLASGTDSAVDYMRQVRSAMGGVLPVDGIAIHPYGQTPPDPTAEPFPNWSTGSLRRTLTRFADTFPGYPIWITELGVPRVDVDNRNLWLPIANYLTKTAEYIRTQFHHLVPALIWFAWGDAMDLAGITNGEQRPKGPIYTQFFQQVYADYPLTGKQATPFDGKLMLAQLSADLVTENTVGELATALTTRVPQVGAVILRTSAGTAWQGRTESKRALAINNPGDIAKWASEMARVRIDIHAWHQVQARSVVDITNEINLITQIAVSPGVSTMILDLDMSFGPKTSTAIRNFMVPLRRNLPQPYHIALSFDATPEFFQNVTLSEWFPFVNSWHPRVTLSGPAPLQLLNAAANQLKPFRKPIIPMLKLDPSGSVAGAVVRQAARLAGEEHNCQAISFWRLGTLGQPEFDAMRGIGLPWLAGYTPRQALGTLTVRTTTSLRIRAVPNPNGDILGVLQPGQQIVAFEKRIIGGIEWARHTHGWSAARNITTGEQYLA